jgi:hypothetical protein
MLQFRSAAPGPVCRNSLDGMLTKPVNCPYADEMTTGVSPDYGLWAARKPR